jgi:hypothetical protein
MGERRTHYAPDPAWLPFLKVIFGFVIVLVLALLAMIIALSKVHAVESYGLDIILGGLLTLSGGFAGWAFRGGRQEEEQEKKRENSDFEQ